MTDLQNSAFKDSTPSATVARIKNILADYGIETTEIWQDSSIPYCHAMSVCMDGTTLRSNGKGTSRELAQASGYGELMERLQMGITGAAESQKAGLHTDISQIKRVPAEFLWEQNQHWYEALSLRFTACTGQTMSARDILWRFADHQGTVAVREYFLPRSGEAVYFPAEIIQKIYCTNGCAAGNTMEEAMVQAISEIVERHHQLRILHEDLTPPNIPEDALSQFPRVWEIIRFLREQGFQVSVKDCSFCTPFPVVCVCLIDSKTGRYHTHFGAFPVFEVALERALTESFQGRTLENVAQYDCYSTKKPGQHDLRAVGDEAFFGSGEKTHKFFHGSPDYPYNQNMGFAGRDNKTLLKLCLDYFRSQGHDVLVQNRSALSFPTCQILIPGISEVMIHRLHPAMDDTRYAIAASKCLRSPASATITDAMALMMHLQQLDQFGSKVRHSRDFSFCSRVPLKLDKTQNEAMMIGTLCYLNYSMGRTGEVIKGIGKLLRLTSGPNQEKLLQLAHYLQQKDTGSMAPPSLLDESRNPFTDFVLHCDMTSCHHCAAKAVCRYNQHRALYTLIKEKTEKLDRIAFIHYLQTI